MRRTALLVLILAPVLASGCSPRAYFADRWNDAKDIFTANVGLGLGAKARVGPLHVGLVGSDGVLGLAGGEFGNCAGPCCGTGELELLCIPFNESQDWIFSFEGRDTGYERGKDYTAIGQVPFVTTKLEEGKNPAYWSQIEVVVGLGLAVRLGLNPGELLDFFLGWFGVDIYSDDREAGNALPSVEKSRHEPTLSTSSCAAPPPRR
jgi:hypothetical protein